MKTYDEYTSLVAADRQRRDNYKLLASCVLPRPIALVSTVSKDGAINLAPFSFFNAVGANPPAVMFSPCTKADGTTKDTVNNLREVGEFVVNVVPFEICASMNQASLPLAPEVNEFETAGFSPIASQFIKPPRVAQAPIHLECKLITIVPVGEGPLSANICIGEVVCFHLASGIYGQDGLANVELLDLVGRLGGDAYSTTRDRFDLPKPKPQ